ncbi:GNAT family N-acetyltransferase [Streptomyces sp. ME01-18a]|uniref:GNAT family N-acetyltransferase n=1 Tax=Streptomyces sp. ME01-18a TaxID=3028669 RepID=UPI0029A9EA31|nr:GNAT family N-acetyltransferase [Streptomyces sp. ME01-18a]MDX3433909.1 GNAT family N-acetyltransferase [Streptomyces sp. ME01-18a]
MVHAIRIVQADNELWQQYDDLATRSYGHPVGDISRLRPHADIRVAVRDGRVIAGGLGLLAPQHFGGAPVPSALLSAGCVAPEERGAHLSVDMLTHRLRHLRDQGAVISTMWTTSGRYVRRLGWEAPTPVFAWSITAEDLKNAFTRTALPIEHGRTQEADNLQRDLAQQWNGLVLRPDWWPAWTEGKHALTTYRFGPPQSPTGLLAFAMKRSERHGMTLTVHDFWAVDEETVRAMMTFLGDHHTRAPVIHFRRSALPPYPALLHNLHRYRPTAEAWHPWMLRILDLQEAVRLRGWPTSLSTTVPVTVEGEEAGSWQEYLLDVHDGTAQINRAHTAGEVRLTRRQWPSGTPAATRRQPQHAS